MRSSDADRPRPSNRFAGRDLGDEYLFYDAGGEQVHVLNGTAREIYLLCDGERTVATLAARYAERYGLDEVAARRDVDEVLKRLAELDLVCPG